MGDVRKKYVKLAKSLLFTYLLLFPFGKLLKPNIVINDWYLWLDLLDLIVLASVPVSLLLSGRRPSSFKYLTDFLMVCLFSLVLSLGYFTKQQVVIGGFYLVRLSAYVYFYIMVWNLVKAKVISKAFVYKSLLGASFFTGVFGWVQYFALPDMTHLKYYGWDDHLYRLIGTFLDPAFTSLIFVFGFILAINYYLENKDKKIFLLSCFLIITLAFTYARGSYLALIAGLVATSYLLKKNFSRILVVILLVFAGTLIMLPRMASEGTLLERTQSIYAKGENYRETIEIVKKYPVFGVGFNNMCIARLTHLGGNPASHACSGADSSLLFVLATTGIVGFLVFINTAINLLQKTDGNMYSRSFLSCAVALFVHSLFVQSAFYPFVMGYLGILYAASSEAKG